MTLGSRPILGGVSVNLEDGARIGVVGPNGGGKTTLLAMITGSLQPDTGKVTYQRDVRIAQLAQADSFPAGQTVREVIHGADATHVWAGDSHIRRLHAGLLPDIELDSLVGELSGGQRRRVALAKTLCEDANVVVLDEPTNHLDIDGITFLAGYLSARFGGQHPEGALVVVTHDRWFLDAVCTRLWEVVPGNDGPGGRSPRPGHVEMYEGGYAAYILQRTERERQARVAAEKRNNMLRKELAWLQRGAPARTSKPRFRIEAAEALIADEPAPRDTMELTRMATSRLGKKVIDLENITFAYPGGSPVLEGVTLRLAPGERLGIMGPNGAGKSSLLGLLSGELTPQSGRVKRGTTVKLAVLDQTTRELDKVADLRVVEAVSDIATHVTVGKKEMTATQLVERMGFTRERAWTPVKDISGGERRRLQLMRLLMGEPNVLLLDEPTNDLDTDTLAAVEDLLDSWPGTLVVVSHDRYLLERLTDHQMAVLDHGLQDLPGGIDQYLKMRETETTSGTAPSAASSENAGPSRSAREREAQKEAGRIERKLTKARGQLDKLYAKQASQSESGDFAALADTSREVSTLESHIGDLEEQWLEAAEAAEELRGN